MSIDKWMDKEDWIHIYNGILLSHKKEHIWVGSNEVDEPRVYYTKWSKSEREKEMSCINAYVQNLERWYPWSFVQGSKGDTAIKRGWDDCNLILEVTHHCFHNTLLRHTSQLHSMWEETPFRVSQEVRILRVICETGNLLEIQILRASLWSSG